MTFPSRDEFLGHSENLKCTIQLQAAGFLLTFRGRPGKNMKKDGTEADKKFVHRRAVIGEEMRDGYFEQVNLFKYL